MKRSLPLLLLGWAVAPGCTAPERSPIFNVNWPEATREAAEAADRDADGVLPEVAFSVAGGPEAGTPAAGEADGNGVLRLTLGRTLLLCLSANRELEVASSTPAVASALARFQRGAFDPEAFAGLTYSEETTSETSEATGTSFNIDGVDINVVAGLSQSLPSGTDIEFSVTQERSNSNRAPEQQDARLGLSVTQQLLDGFGSEANLVELRQAQLEVVASEHELRAFTEQLLAQAEQAWWLYRLAEQRLDLFERAVEVAEKQGEAARRRVAAGALASTAAAAAEAEAALRRQDLIDARSLAESRRLNLLRLLGGPTGAARDPDSGWLDRPLETVATGAEVFAENNPDPGSIDDLPDRIRLAARMRPELREARVRLEQDRLETVLTRNGLLPDLEVFLDLGKSGFGDTVRGSFDDLDSDSFDLSTGFRFSAPLGNDEAIGLDLAATANRMEGAAAVANLEELVGVEVRLAAVELERARQQIAASRATLDFQRAVAAAERQRFEAGDATSLDAALASRDLVAAEVAVLTSRTEHRLALIDLHLAEGSLLQRRGIAVASPSARRSP